jgi:predicted DNA-binding protein
LEELSKKTGIPKSELIRIAVKALIEEYALREFLRVLKRNRRN